MQWRVEGGCDGPGHPAWGHPTTFIQKSVGKRLEMLKNKREKGWPQASRIRGRVFSFFPCVLGHSNKGGIRKKFV